jgi:hypothetical protein
MNRYRTRLLKIAAIILAVVLASLIFPPYRDYCNANYANKYYCSVYEIFAAFFAFVELHNGAFTVIATVAIAWFTLSLRESTDKLGTIGNATAITQERDTKILQRAYLAVVPQGVEPKESDKRTLLAYVGITNTGHLPARKVRSYINFQPATNGELKDFPTHKAEGANVVAPGITMRKNSIKPLPVSEIEKLSKQGSLFFYVWGIVYYHDGFTDGRHIRFCHRYAWESFRDLPGGAGLAASALEARHHEYGNGTDEDAVETL